MSDKKTPADFVREIKEPAGYAGHGEYLFDANQATEVAKAYADQELTYLRDQVNTWKEEYATARRQAEEFRKELASLRDQLTNEKDHSNDLFNNLVQVQKQLKQKEDENRELVNEIDQLILHAEEDSLTYSVLEHARKLVFKTNHPDGYKKAN